MGDCDDLISDPATGRFELSLAERAVLLFPLDDRAQSISDQKRPPSCRGHPGRDTDSFSGCRSHDLLMDVWVNRDRELR